MGEVVKRLEEDIKHAIYLIGSYEEKIDEYNGYIGSLQGYIEENKAKIEDYRDAIEKLKV